MAKWGEGDPRWIVEERPDATNVNNWHWTEKNAGPWSKQRLKELLEGLEVENPSGRCKITELKTCEGEASANNRKAKLIFFYEWEIKCTWEGSVTNSTDKYEGTVEIPNLSDEQTADDIDVNVTMKSSESNALTLKEIMRKDGLIAIRKQLAKYVVDLKEEFSKGLILPTKDSVAKKPPAAQHSVKREEVGSEMVLNPEFAKKHNTTEPVRILTKTLELKETFKCSGADLYRALTMPDMIKAFTNNSSTVDSSKGGKFSMYGGMVEGSFIELVPNSRIVMLWRMKLWPDGHYSTVVLEIKETEDDCHLQLRQTQVPEAHCERTEDGWRRHYFDAMKSTFGFGARLF